MSNIRMHFVVFHIWNLKQTQHYILITQHIASLFATPLCSLMSEMQQLTLTFRVNQTQAHCKVELCEDSPRKYLQIYNCICIISNYCLNEPLETIIVSIALALGVWSVQRREVVYDV